MKIKRSRKSPAKRKTQKQDLFRPQITISLAIVITLISLFFGGYVAYRNAMDLRSLDLAERKLEMTKLPPSIRRKIATATPSATFQIPILMYHYIEIVQDRKDKVRQSLDILPFVLEKQIETLKIAGYTFLTMRDVADIMDGKMALMQKPIVLTFDDGYRDFYTDVFPIVRKENINVVAYVVPGFLDKPNFLLTSQLLEIARSNLVEIAAHTMHHIYLKNVNRAAATSEIVESKIILESLTGLPIVSFSYPYGAFDEQALQLVKNAGFRTATSTIPGKEENEANRFFIYRLRPGARTGNELLRFLDQTKFKPW